MHKKDSRADIEHYMSGSGSREKGMMDLDQIFMKLKKEHKVVQQIMKEIEATTSRAQKKREELFIKLNEKIAPHMKGEEKALYPVLMGIKSLKELTLESVEEHNVANILAKELMVMPTDSERWHAKFKVLMENVQHHIEEEENKLFPQAQKLLTPDDTSRIYEEYEKEEEKQKDNIIRKIERKITQKI